MRTPFRTSVRSIGPSPGEKAIMNRTDRVLHIPDRSCATYTQTGAPLHRKVISLWNPALPKKVRGSETATRKEPTTDAIEVLAGALLKGDRPTQAITFIRTLAGVQRFNDTLRKRLKRDRNPASEKTAAYCGRLLLRDRDEIAEGLLSHQIVHVTSTNALELGITSVRLTLE